MTDQLVAQYTKRIQHYAQFQIKAIKDESASILYPKAFRIAVDPRGKQMTSEELAQLLERTSREIVFFIGGPDGFSDTLRTHADPLVSLSKMTLSHEQSRVVLVEQIYRAFTILRNHPYPR